MLILSWTWEIFQHNFLDFHSNDTNLLLRTSTQIVLKANLSCKYVYAEGWIDQARACEVEERESSLKFSFLLSKFCKLFWNIIHLVSFSHRDREQFFRFLSIYDSFVVIVQPKHDKILVLPFFLMLISSSIYNPWLLLVSAMHSILACQTTRAFSSDVLHPWNGFIALYPDFADGLTCTFQCMNWSTIHMRLWSW